jgi:zinc protease
VAPASLKSEKRLIFEDRVQVPRLWIEWPTVNMYSADEPALELLGEILAGSRTARLTKPLVYDKQIAANVTAGQTGAENVGTFSVVVTPRPEHSLTEVETQVDSIITRLKRDGPTAEELKRVKAGQELDFLSGLQSNLGKAFQLAEDQTFRNDPSYTFHVGYAKTQAVTAADVKRVANRYLGSARVVLSNVPINKRQLASHPEKSTVVTDPLTEKTTEIKP